MTIRIRTGLAIRAVAAPQSSGPRNAIHLSPSRAGQSNSLETLYFTRHRYS